MNNNKKIIKNKLGLIKLAEELGNVSRAYKVMGYSRDTFYRYKELVEEGGIDNLIEKTRRKPNYHNRVDEQTEQAVIDIAIDYPAYRAVPCQAPYVKNNFLTRTTLGITMYP